MIIIGLIMWVVDALLIWNFRDIKVGSVAGLIVTFMCLLLFFSAYTLISAGLKRWWHNHNRIIP